MAEIEKSNSFIDMEHEVLKFWEDNDCYNKRTEKNTQFLGGKRLLQKT